MMTSDFKLVAQFLRDKRLGKNDIMYDKTKITHIDEILKLLAAMTADRRYTDWLKTDEYKEVDTMCELFDRAMNERIERAMKEKEAQMKEQEAQMKEQEAQMKEQEAQMKEQEAQMKEQEAQMKEQEAQIKENEAQIKEQDAIIAELRKQLAVYQNQ